MNQKISDFRIAEYILRLFCKKAGVHFVDMPIEFTQKAEPDSVHESKIFISNPDKYSKTLFRIVGTYLMSLAAISGEDSLPQTSEYVMAAAAMIRDFTSSDEVFPESFEQLPVTLHLNRDPFVWLSLRDIICPSYQKPLHNVKVIAAKSAVWDAAQFVDAEKMSMEAVIGQPVAIIKDQHEPFLFVNMEVENYAYRAAFMLHEALKIHDLNPKVIIRELFTDTELSDKFTGFLRIAFVRDELLTDFMMMLSILGDVENAHMLIDAKSQTTVKNAQMDGGMGGGSGSHSSFWQLGLTEKMLQPARGPDWSTYFRMKPFTDKLWAKVDKEKRRRGLKELPMELLLRVQSKDRQARPDLIIQGLLADNRVW